MTSHGAGTERSEEKGRKNCLDSDIGIISHVGYTAWSVRISDGFIVLMRQSRQLWLQYALNCVPCDRDRLFERVYIEYHVSGAPQGTTQQLRRPSPQNRPGFMPEQLQVLGTHARFQTREPDEGRVTYRETVIDLNAFAGGNGIENGRVALGDNDGADGKGNDGEELQVVRWATASLRREIKTRLHVERTSVADFRRWEEHVLLS
ncbi:hypothetical protein AURDEDRAFT_122668 [Auricularia subglabra TFB-10046 SS5]|nr:hypothetical protein AURDEDRAFT_122668 [Auricularia subglabra TFB-10046 SS5]